LKNPEAQTRQRPRPAGPARTHVRTRRWQPTDRGGQPGFLLPLAIMGALLLVTSNVALQLADLQIVQAQAVEEERNSDNDQLLSAAHLIGDYIIPSKTQFSCLSALEFSQWSCRVSAIRPIVNASSLATTVNKFMATGDFSPVTIKNWSPTRSGSSLTGGVLTLEATDNNNVKQQKSFYIRFPGGGRISTATEEPQS